MATKYEVSNSSVTKYTAESDSNTSTILESSQNAVLTVIAFIMWPSVKIFEIISNIVFVSFAPLRIWALFLQTVVASLEIVVQSIEGIRNGKGISEFIKSLPESSWIRSYIKQVKEILDDILGYKPTENGNVNPPIDNSKADQLKN